MIYRNRPYTQVSVVQLEWVWFNLSGCCYLQVYLIVSKIGGEEGGVSVQDVFQQLCEERERESATV